MSIIRAAIEHMTNVAKGDYGTFDESGRHIVHSFYAGDNQYYTREETFDNGSNDSHMLDDVLLFLIPGNVRFS